MRKLIAAMNMTLDGFCDHTSMTADDKIHQHYTELLRSAGILLYGRITYQLMEYWRSVVENPTGNKAMDEFAVTMDNTPKVVYSRTLASVDWKDTVLKREIVNWRNFGTRHFIMKNLFLKSPENLRSMPAPAKESFNEMWRKRMNGS